MSLEYDPGGTYLRDADTVGLIMKCGRIVIHIPELDVNLLVITWQDKRGELMSASASGLFPPEGPRTLPPLAAGALGDTHPLVVADRELHSEL